MLRRTRLNVKGQWKSRGGAAGPATSCSTLPWCETTKVKVCLRATSKSHTKVCFGIRTYPKCVQCVFACTSASTPCVSWSQAAGRKTQQTVVRATH